MRGYYENSERKEMVQPRHTSFETIRLQIKVVALVSVAKTYGHAEENSYKAHTVLTLGQLVVVVSQPAQVLPRSERCPENVRGIRGWIQAQVAGQVSDEARVR